MSSGSHARHRRRVKPAMAAAAAVAAVVVTAIAVGFGTSGASSRQASPTPPRPVPGPAAALSPVTAVSAPASTTTTQPTPAELAVAALAGRIAPLLTGLPSCVMVSDDHGVVYQSNPATSLAPASTQKLLVALAALETLGPDYRFVTKVVAASAPKGGVVGNLWLVGGGDPMLATSAFAAWWNGQPRYAASPMTSFDALGPALRAAGVVSVPGGIHGDDSRYDPARTIATWPPSAVADHEINPLSALTLNEGYQAWLAQTIVPADPAAFAAGTLSASLAPAGITAPAAPDSPAPPNSVVLAQVTSAPLSAVVGAMLRSSDNQIAELMVKELGYHHDGTGTTAGGISAVESTDAALGVPLTGVLMRDGSGLDYGDRSTCAALLTTLSVGSQPQFAAIPAGLAVAGQSGTLTRRWCGKPEAGTLRAKSGSTYQAGGLVGLLDLGHPVSFAMLFNVKESDAALFGHEDSVIQAIAPYATNAP